MATQVPNPNKSRFAFAAGVVALVLVVFGLEGYNLWRLRTVAIENQLGSAAQYANAFEEHLTQTLGVVDVNLITLGEQAVSAQTLQEVIRNARYLRSISVVNAEGLIEASSEPRNVGVAFNADAFLPQSAKPLPLLRVGPLSQGRDLYEARATTKGEDAPAQSFLAVQRDVPQAQGGFVKLVAVINPDYFLNYYGRNVDVEAADVELLRLDGGLILSTAQRFSPGSNDNAVVMDLLAKAESGRVRDESVRQRGRLSAYRVSKYFPIVAVVHMDHAKGLDSWRVEALWTAAVLFVMLALMLAMAVYYFLRFQRLAEERKTWARALNDQKHALDQHAIVSITDSAGVITYANDRFCTISGYDRNELLGHHHRVVKSAHHPASFFEALWHTISQGEVWHGEVCNRKKNGELYWVSATIVPLMGVDGFVQQYIAIRTDITERKAIEQSLEIAKSAAEQASEAKSQFLANMSHEIRTPMNAILGLLKLTQSTDLSPRQRDYIDKSYGAAQSLLGLLNDILDFSKVEAGKMALERETFGFHDLLRDLSVVLSANAGTKDIEVLFDIDPRLPDVVLGDVMRLQQVLINLGGNAVKFTEVGQVVLTLKSLATAQNMVRVEFLVRDSGIGIASENQAHIFSGFSQAEGSTTRRFGGTGLGLAISQRLVELMGGKIEISSTLGVGSTFSFAIDFPVSAEIPQGRLSAGLPSQPPHAVLVVDDNPIAGEITARAVQSWGWTAQWVGSGAAALTRIEQDCKVGGHEFPYPTIFMDWQMPDMDGWETTKRIRKFAGSNGLPQPKIVMLTAHGRDNLAQRSEAEQRLLSGFLSKPATPSMLFDAVMDASSGAAGMRRDSRAPASARRLNGMRILVVEDNLINQQVADELLSSEGALVFLAFNGRLGVEAVQSAAPQYDVVLMDLQMPVLDGYGATQEIREGLRLRTLPIVAMTANAMASDREACLAAGMNEHIGKPFDMDKLVALLIDVTQFKALPADDSPVLHEGDANPLDLVTPGIDMATALARMSGMRSLYLRTGKAFVKALDTCMTEIQVQLDNGNTKALVMQLHTLKGNAGTLGVGALAEIARELERQLKDSDGVAALVQGMDALASAVALGQGQLHHALEMLDQQVAASVPSSPGLPSATQDNATALEALRSIFVLTGAANMDALAVCADSRDVLERLNAPLFDELDSALQELDFDRAHALCEAYLGKPG